MNHYTFQRDPQISTNISKCPLFDIFFTDFNTFQYNVLQCDLTSGVRVGWGVTDLPLPSVRGREVVSDKYSAQENKFEFFHNNTLLHLRFNKNIEFIKKKLKLYRH